MSGKAPLPKALASYEKTRNQQTRAMYHLTVEPASFRAASANDRMLFGTIAETPGPATSNGAGLKPFGLEPSGRFDRPVRKDHRCAGSADRQQGLVDDPVAVDPSALGSSFDHRVLAGHLVGSDRHR
jgi:hypothetical protein